MKKIIILVLTYNDGGGYLEMDECVRNTWGKIHKENIEVYYYYLKHLEPGEEILVENNNIYVNGLESMSNISYKTIKSFEYLITKDFDYLLRTNSSSFIHLPNLISTLKNAPTKKFYSGNVLSHRSEDFVSGSGFILSKDCVKYIVDNKSDWSNLLPDDVNVGKQMKNYEVTPNHIGWVKFKGIPKPTECVQVELYNDDKSVTHKCLQYSDIIKEIGSKHQIRCKIETFFDIPTQVGIFNQLNKLIYN